MRPPTLSLRGAGSGLISSMNHLFLLSRLRKERGRAQYRPMVSFQRLPLRPLTLSNDARKAAAVSGAGSSAYEMAAAKSAHRPSTSPSPRSGSPVNL